MTNARPNALSLAVAVAISSSIIGTQALADRKLQTKSVDIPSDGHAEFTQSEVVVKPTLGENHQPIPNSFTTTYPDQAQARAGYNVPSEGFSDVLSGVDGGVSSVDLFETGDDDVAQKYTKVLKVGDEGVFRFTQNFEENELVIEVRGGMTDHDSVEAVRAQLVGNDQLEPLTKISNPGQLAGVLKGANGRAGNLGAGDNYVALVTIEVEEVEVNGRTFMRLISSGDQPPELQRLGQSLFVNDEALLAAATSAYTQVHVLGEDLQQEALTELLAYQKPVGYVVHVEDDAQAYPVPEGYPKLEVTQAPGEIIVFHGQKLNPADAAFVEGLYNLKEAVEGDQPAPAVTTQVKKDKVKSYQYIIRSRQMELLEEFAAALVAQHDAVLDEEKLQTLAYYEYLQQALSSATPDGDDEFEFTRAHIKVSSWAITPTWMKVQLAKFFSFKPSLQGLLANQQFIQQFMPVVTGVAAAAYGDDKEFAIKVIGDMTKQLLEMENKLEQLQAKEGELARLRNQLQTATERANASDEEKLRAQQLKQQVEDQLEQVRRELEQQRDRVQELQQEADRIPELQAQVDEARKEAAVARNREFAQQLNIQDWDDTKELDEQNRLIQERVRELNQQVADAVRAQDDTVKQKLALIEAELGLQPDDGDSVDDRTQAIQNRLQQQAEEAGQEAARTEAAIKAKLAILEGELGLHPGPDDSVDARTQAIQNRLQQQAADADEATQAAIKAKLAILEGELGLHPDAGDSVDDRTEALRNRLQQQVANAGQEAERTAAAIKAKLAILEGELGLHPDAGDSVDDRTQAIQNRLQQQAADAAEQTQAAVKEKLALFEARLGLNPDAGDSVDDRTEALQNRLQRLTTGAREETEAAVKAKLTVIEGELGLHPDAGDSVDDRTEAIRNRLQQQAAEADEQTQTAIKEKLAVLEGELGLHPDAGDTVDDRTQALQNRLQQQAAEVREQSEAAVKAKLAVLEGELGLQPDDGDSVDDRTQALQNRLQQQTAHAAQEAARTEAAIKEKLAVLEGELGLHPAPDDSVDARTQAIQNRLQQQAAEADETTQAAIKEKLANLEGELDLHPDAGDTVDDRTQALQNRLQQQVEHAGLEAQRTAAAIKEKLAIIEGELGLHPDDGDSVDDRTQAIQNRLQQHAADADEQTQAAIKEKLAVLEGELGLHPDAGDTVDERTDALQTRLQRQADEVREQSEVAVKAKLAILEGELGLHPDAGDSVDDRTQAIQNRLQQQAAETDERVQAAVKEKLALLEGELGLHPDAGDSVDDRTQALQNRLQQQAADVREQSEAAVKAKLAVLEGELGLQPDDGDSVDDRTQALQNRLQQQAAHAGQEAARTEAALKEKLAILEGELGLHPDAGDSVDDRTQAIQNRLQQQAADADQTTQAAIKEKLAILEGELGLHPDAGDSVDDRTEALRNRLQQQVAQAGEEAQRTAAAIKEKLAILEGELGLHPDDGDSVDDRTQAIQNRLQQQAAQADEQKIADIKARYRAIADQLNIQGFDGDADIDEQQQVLLQRIQQLNAAGGGNEADIKAKQDALAAVLNIELDEDGTVDDRNGVLEEAMQGKVDRVAELEEALEDMRTPGHPQAKPEVEEKLGEVEEALEMDDLDEEDDEYLRRRAISEDMKKYITQARERSEEEAIEVLEILEEKLNLEVDEDDDRAARLAKVREKLAADDLEEGVLDEIEIALRDDDAEAEAPEGTKDEKLQRLRDRLTNEVEDVDERARERQTELLEAAEDKLDIDIDENAEKRGKAFSDDLAGQLDVEFDDDDPDLDDRKGALKAKIQALDDEVGQGYADEGVRRNRNIEIAQQLGIEDFDEAAEIDAQNRVLREKLQQLDGQVDRAGQYTVQERIADIDAELDKQMARLGPKPRYVLDREVAWSRQLLAEAQKELDAVRRKQVDIVGRAGVHPITDDEATTLNQRMKQIQTELGLVPEDEQTTAERVEAIRQHLQGDGAGRRADAVQKLRTATTDLHIHVDGIEGVDDANLEEPQFLDAITAHAANHGVEEVEEVAGKLPETRRKYTQVTDFLNDHDQKHLDVTNAERAQADAQRDLDAKKQEITNFVGDDQPAKTRLQQQKDQLELRLKHANDALPPLRKTLSDHEALLKTTEEAMGLKPTPADEHEARVDALRNKQAQLGGGDGNGGEIHRLTQEQARLEGEIEARQEDFQTRTVRLAEAKEAVEHDGSPFQYTPKQGKVQADMHTYMHDHSLKKQALEAAIGLAESAESSGKEKPNLLTFDFDDEFAPIRLQALVGDDLSFDQARRIVEVFKNLKTAFPAPPPVEEGEVQPISVLEEAQQLADKARAEMKTGAQQYDDEIHGMGASAIHFVEYDPRDLKGFSEYFATHSASGNKIIVLLRDGLISKAELENYMMAARDVAQLQVPDPSPEQIAELRARTLAFEEQYHELEHFLGYKHGVKVADFKSVVKILSEDGVEEFMQRAFNPVAVTTTGPAGMKESVAGMKEYAASVIANYVLDDIAFENGRKTAAFLANIQDTLTPYANTVGMSESDLLKIINGTLMQAHAAAVEHQVFDYWVKPSAFLVQAVSWYFTSYKPLLATNTAWQAAKLSFSNMSFLYLLDLTNRGDYLHRMPTPFQNWMERYGIDLDRSGQYAYHSGIEQVSEVGGLVMPFGKAASSVILLRTGTMLFARQYHANPQMYRSISRLVPQMLKSMSSRQGVQVPLLHRMTPQKVKTLASTTAGVVLGPVTTAGAYAYGLVSGFTYAQTFGAALAAGITYDFFMNDNKVLTQWLGGPLGRGLDSINRWRGVGEADDEYVKRNAVATPQRYGESDAAYAKRVKDSNMMHGWTRNESYLQFRERRDRTMKMFEDGWEKYFKENVPKWSFSHAESIPYSYTLGAFYDWQQGDDKEVPVHDETRTPKPTFTPPPVGNELDDDEDWESTSESTVKPTATSSTSSTSATSATSASSEAPSVTSSVTQTTSAPTPVETPTVAPADLDEDEQWETEATTTTEATITTPSTTSTEALVTSEVVSEPTSSVVQTTTTTESVIKPTTTQTTTSSVTPVTSETPVVTPSATVVSESAVVTEPETTPPAKLDTFEEDEEWETTKPAPVTTSTTTTAATITPATTTSTTTTSTTTTVVPKETPAVKKPDQADLDEFDLDEDWGDDEDIHDEL
ncbi:hypothetical protein [Endozoicomonas arenosclerae]|uniref:hypothetical protein n=1 Tax=Endozoicomonas arenosclerae TaxID=1633495 RepID=UPI000781E90F|nr:hypothetical protein [Endozoicomonas arenosclerae]